MGNGKTQQTVTIATRSGPIEQPAKAVQGQWAVHKPYIAPQDQDGTPWTKFELRDLEYGWVVTHAPSGYRVQTCDTLQDAILTLRALAPVKLTGPDDKPGLNEVRRALGLPIQKLPSKPRRRA